jgi:hypothetical protein
MSVVNHKKSPIGQLKNLAAKELSNVVNKKILQPIVHKVESKEQIKPTKNARKKEKRKENKTTSVMAPSAIATKHYTKHPTVHQRGDGRTIVQHTEYVADVFGSASYVATTYNINPGLATTFPYGSKWAGLYESYRPISFSVDYTPTVATTTAGLVMMAFDFDAIDAAPTSKVDLLSIEGAYCGQAWVPGTCRAPKKMLNNAYKTRYVRSASVANSDIKTYDCALLTIATLGMSGATVVGDLRITYTFELINPQIASVSYYDSLLGTRTMKWSSTSTNRSSPLLSATATNALGNTIPNTSSPNNYAYPVTWDNSDLYFAGSGNYLAILRWTGTAITSATPGGSGGSGGVSPSSLYSIVDSAQTNALAVLKFNVVPNYLAVPQWGFDFTSVCTTIATLTITLLSYSTSSYLFDDPVQLSDLEWLQQFRQKNDVPKLNTGIHKFVAPSSDVEIKGSDSNGVQYDFTLNSSAYDTKAQLINFQPDSFVNKPSGKISLSTCSDDSKLNPPSRSIDTDHNVVTKSRLFSDAVLVDKPHEWCCCSDCCKNWRKFDKEAYTSLNSVMGVKPLFALINSLYHAALNDMRGVANKIYDVDYNRLKTMYQNQQDLLNFELARLRDLLNASKVEDDSSVAPTT